MQKPTEALAAVLAMTSGLPVPVPTGGPKQEHQGTGRCGCGRTISANKTKCKACAETVEVGDGPGR